MMKVDVPESAIGIVCGLPQEARIAGFIPKALVGCTTARISRTGDVARALMAQGADQLLSFGIAGALAPDLPVGSVVIADKIISKKGTWICHQPWVQDLAVRLPGAHIGSVWGTDFILSGKSAKQNVYDVSHALAADMESHGVAETAAAAQLPFAVLRVVSDIAQFEFPPAALLPLQTNGTPDLGAIFYSLIRQPGQLKQLMQLARDSKKAFAELARVARAIS